MELRRPASLRGRVNRLRSPATPTPPPHHLDAARHRALHPHRPPPPPHPARPRRTPIRPRLQLGHHLHPPAAAIASSNCRSFTASWKPTSGGTPPHPSRRAAAPGPAPARHRRLRRGEVEVPNHPVDHLLDLGQRFATSGSLTSSPTSAGSPVSLVIQPRRRSCPPLGAHSGRQTRISGRCPPLLRSIVADKPGSLTVVRHFGPIVADKSGLPRIACPRLGLCDPFIPVHLPAAPLLIRPGRLRPLQAQSHARPSAGRSFRATGCNTFASTDHMVRLRLAAHPPDRPSVPATGAEPSRA